MKTKSTASQLSINSILLFLTVLVADSTGNTSTMSDDNLNSFGNESGLRNESHLSTNNSIKDIAIHPAFKGFSQYILPWDDNRNYYDTRLADVGSILPYHSHVDPSVVVSAVNHMIDEINAGRTIFFDFYSEQQRQKDPSKESTGLFFFKGKPGHPFAIVCPGGGFTYVGSLHEGFPHAVELSNRGYNVFVLKYRVGSGLKASEDLSAALSYIFQNAEVFEASTKGYSLWGSSAGARMVGDIALHGVAYFGGSDLPSPCAVIIAYTGHSSFSRDYPPAFIMVSEDDTIVSVPIVDKRVEKFRNTGIDVEYRKYKNSGHGFGLGVGTDATGWLEHALRFWEKYLPKEEADNQLRSK